MTRFLSEDFLLESPVAVDLYHRCAAGLPIIDYHCHLSPEQMATDHRFASIAEIWLDGDHYKWRAMRANGVDERYCTGGASAWEKFEAWARTVPDTLRNPLYHWTHMELRRPFGVDELLSPATARGIFDRCNERLEEDGFTVLAAPDGEAAWELLLKNHDRVDVVVTDIEMPRLTGLGLAARIRADERTARLPIIAVTSLAGDEDIARGQAAGISEYQVKLDRDTLLASVHGLVHA